MVISSLKFDLNSFGVWSELIRYLTWPQISWTHLVFEMNSFGIWPFVISLDLNSMITMTSIACNMNWFDMYNMYPKHEIYYIYTIYRE